MDAILQEITPRYPMGAMITLYILGGCVALAGLLFLVMVVLAAFRSPQLPDLPSFEAVVMPAPRMPTPRPMAVPAAIRAVELAPISHATAPMVAPSGPPRTVIPLPPIEGVAPPTLARTPRGTVSPPVSSTFGAQPSASFVEPPTASPPTWVPPTASRRSAEQLVARPTASPLTWETRTQRPAPGVQPATVSGEMRPSAPVVQRSSAPALPLPAPPTTPVPPKRASAASMPPARPSPISWTPPPRVTPLPLSPAAVLGPPRRSSANMLRPNAPPQRPGALRTYLGGFVAFLLLAASPAVVEPTLLDPLCEDYEWDGAEAAVIARDYAREANIAIDGDALLDTTMEKLESPATPTSPPSSSAAITSPI